MFMPLSRLRVLNLGEALNLAIQLFQRAALNDILGRLPENCHSQGVPFCIKMDGHRRVLFVLNAECRWPFIRSCSGQPVSPTYAALQAVQLLR